MMMRTMTSRQMLGEGEKGLEGVESRESQATHQPGNVAADERTRMPLQSLSQECAIQLTPTSW